MNDRNKSSEPKPPKNSFQKILILLGLLVVVLAFLGGISTAVLFMNRKKILSEEQPPVNPSPSPSNILSSSSPTASPSPSPSNILSSSSPTASPFPSPSNILSSSSPTASPFPSPSNILSSSSPTVSPSSPLGTKDSIGVVDRQGLTFELQSCKKSITDGTNQKIQCLLNITSTQDNSQVYLYLNQNQSTRTRILALGQENVATGGSLGSYSGAYSVGNNLIKNISMTASIYFEKVPEQIKKIEVLEISAAHQGDIKIEFRNVPLSNS